MHKESCVGGLAIAGGCYSKMCCATDLSSPQLFGSKPQFFAVSRLSATPCSGSQCWAMPSPWDGNPKHGVSQGFVKAKCAHLKAQQAANFLSVHLDCTLSLLPPCHCGRTSPALNSLSPGFNVMALWRCFQPLISPFPPSFQPTTDLPITAKVPEQVEKTQAWRQPESTSVLRDLQRYCTARELEDFLNFLAVTTWDIMLWWDFLLSTRNDTMIRWQKSRGGGNTCTQLTEGRAFAFTACYQK